MLIDSFEHANLQRNEYELRINSLSLIDKAQILYNHIWHSSLKPDYIEEIYLERRYRSVISHRNFNPRLISYITDSTRLDNCPPADYWQYIVRSLENPAHIWENPFIAQQDDFGRAIVLLVVINGSRINEDTLSDAYYRYIGLPDNRNMNGRRDFHANMRQLTGSFLNRSIAPKGPAVVDLFNPSIGDYVLQRYSGDRHVLLACMFSLLTEQSLVTLKSLRHNGILTQAQSVNICESLLHGLAEGKFNGVGAPYLSTICDLLIEWSEDSYEASHAIGDAALYILEKSSRDATAASYSAIQWAVRKGIVTPDRALSFITANIEDASSDSEIRAVSLILSALPDDMPEVRDCEERLKSSVVDLMSGDLWSFIDVHYAFSQADYGETGKAEREIEKLIEEKLDFLGVSLSRSDFNSIIDEFDVAYELERYYVDACEEDYSVSRAPATLSIDEIDDLFDRG